MLQLPLQEIKKQLFDVIGYSLLLPLANTDQGPIGPYLQHRERISKREEIEEAINAVLAVGGRGGWWRKFPKAKKRDLL